MRNRIENADLTAVISMALFAAFPVIAWAAPVLSAGITASSQSLVGMTAKETKAAAQEYVDSLSVQSVTLSVDGQDVATTAGELSFHWINTDTIDEAAGQYAGGSLIKQYMIEKGLAAAPVDIELETEMNSTKVKAFVDTQCQGITVEPRNASIIRENGQFVIMDSVPGRVVNVAGTEAALNETLEAGLEKPIEATAQVTEEQPATINETLATIQNVLGAYIADFSSNGTARSTNLAVGAAKVNGHMLMPEDVLSGYECLQPFTIANGYKTAAAYENGQVVDSIGGGVCQLATTLYNASLEAEVEIIRGQNHSMIAIYVKPSRGAAIAGTYKDIKIQNNYSTPTYVEGYTSGRKLTFTIYGEETRPANRKVEYVSETLGSTNPGKSQLIVDSTLAPGTRVKVQSSHIGLRSRLWEVVTVDGVEQERTLLNKGTYNASKAIYQVGPDLPVTSPVVPDATAPVGTAPVETAPAETASITGVEGGPDVTQPAPEATPAPEANPAVNPAPAGGGPTVTPVEGPQCGRPDRDQADLRSVTAS